MGTSFVPSGTQCRDCDYGVCATCRGDGQLAAVDSRRESPALTGRTLIFEIGSEFAPDAPWGSDHLRLRDDGTVRYENRDHGRLRVSAGSLSRDRVARVFAALDASGFPKLPEHRIPPGASLAQLTVVDRGRSDSQRFHYYFAEGLSEYEDLLLTCTGLARALRTNDTALLDAWNYRCDPTEAR